MTPDEAPPAAAQPPDAALPAGAALPPGAAPPAATEPAVEPAVEPEAPLPESPPTLRVPVFNDPAFTMAEPLPPALLEPPAPPATVAVVTPPPPAPSPAPAPTAPAPAPARQPQLVSEQLETGGASVVRRVFSFIGLVLWAVFLGAGGGGGGGRRAARG